MNSSATRCLKRLQKEREEFSKYPNFTLEVDNANDFLWRISFYGADETLYAGEFFTLQFKFAEEYVKIKLKSN